MFKNNIENKYPEIICNLTQDIMKDPVITNNGISYEKKDIEQWLLKNSICPITNKYLDKTLLIPNIHLKNTILHIKHNFFVKEPNKNNACCIIV